MAECLYACQHPGVVVRNRERGSNQFQSGRPCQWAHGSLSLTPEQSKSMLKGVSSNFP